MNPAVRYDELRATELLQVWINGKGSAYPLGNGDNPDIRLDFNEGGSDYVEVKQDIDPAKAQLWGDLLNFCADHSVPLGEGMGLWWFRINESFDVRRRNELVSKALFLKRMYNGVHWDEEDARNANLLLDLCTQNGIEAFRKVENTFGDNRALIMPAGSSGMVNRDPEIAEYWINQLLTTERWQQSFQKVAKRSANAAHLFFWVESGTPQDIALMWSFMEDDVPTFDLELPYGIRHLWISSSLSFSKPLRAWHYEIESGWEMVYAK